MTYISLISPEDLCSWTELIRDVWPMLCHCLSVARQLEHLLIERDIVGGPVASSQNVRLVSTDHHSGGELPCITYIQLRVTEIIIVAIYIHCTIMHYEVSDSWFKHES